LHRVPDKDGHRDLSEVAKYPRQLCKPAAKPVCHHACGPVHAVPLRQLALPEVRVRLGLGHRVDQLSLDAVTSLPDVAQFRTDGQERRHMPAAMIVSLLGRYGPEAAT
jgi:hypothetical protein